MKQLMRYVLNEDKKTAHERPTEERCNFDQVKHRSFSEVVPEGYKLCGWCKRRNA